jgi:hypothetical protein
MKAFALALGLVALTPAFASTVTCEGEANGQAVKVVIERDDATGLATNISAAVNGTATGSYTGEGLASEIQTVEISPGVTVPALIVVGADETSAVVSIVLTVEGETAALVALGNSDVVIEEAVLACSVQ